MYFVFDALTIDNEEQNFQFQVNEQHMELGLDVLSAIVNKGSKLNEVLLVFDNSVTRLPVSLFDGQSFATPIQQLQSQWQEILRSVPKEPVRSDTVQSLFQRANAAKQGRIDNLKESRERMEKLLQQASQKPSSQHLLNHYQTVIDKYSRLIANYE